MDPRSCPANLLFPSAIWVRGFGMIRKSRSEPTVVSSYLSTPNSSSDTCPVLSPGNNWLSHIFSTPCSFSVYSELYASHLTRPSFIPSCLGPEALATFLLASEIHPHVLSSSACDHQFPSTTPMPLSFLPHPSLASNTQLGSSCQTCFHPCHISSLPNTSLPGAESQVSPKD